MRVFTVLVFVCANSIVEVVVHIVESKNLRIWTIGRAAQTHCYTSKIPQHRMYFRMYASIMSIMLVGFIVFFPFGLIPTDEFYCHSKCVAKIWPKRETENKDSDNNTK